MNINNDIALQDRSQRHEDLYKANYASTMLSLGISVGRAAPQRVPNVLVHQKGDTGCR
mgnify:CR=1 FL=1